MRKNSLFGSCSESAFCKACLSLLSTEDTEDKQRSAQTQFLAAHLKAEGNSQLVIHACEYFREQHYGVKFTASISTKSIIVFP